MDVADRFWAKVERGPSCWLWVGAKNPQGYGKIFVPGTPYMGAHRVAWTLAHGAIPNGLSVLHKCDVPSCVRPSHLFIGKQSDNMRDCARKGRIKTPDNRGENYGAAKLTEKMVLEIRALCKEGALTQSDIAKRFNVSRENISQIHRRTTWRHL